MTIPKQYFIDPDSGLQDDTFFVFHKDQLLVRGNSLSWEKAEIGHFLVDTQHLLLIETDGNTRYLAAQIGKDISESVGAELVSLRKILVESDKARFRYPGLGNQIINWYSSHRYCGRCGSQTDPHESERALVCNSCKLTYYPRINPCVIVLVTKGKEILLARHARFRTGFYSCLAGFMEVGETPEQTIKREVKEEVGIEVENIRYVKSQSWPFPSQLMLGFFADYKSGDLQPDLVEIDEAAWFMPEDLPPVPSPDISVAGELIDLHRQKFI